MSSTLYFDVWSSSSPNGTSLGELSHSYDREFRAVDNAPGSGQFTINRHDTQYAWCAVDNYVRVRRVAGGPFGHGDDRYIGGFWIEEGSDALVSPDEEGGEEVTRGGRTTEACLRWAILYPDAFDTRNRQFTLKTRKTGNWIINERTAGEVLAIFIRDLNDRTPHPLPFLTKDFGVTEDTVGTSWSDADTKWRIPVGTNGLDLLETCVSGDLFYRITPDFVMHAYEDDPGRDLHSTVVIAKGTDLADAANRDIHARTAVSRALVQGTLDSGELKFREVHNSTLESSIGRREGFVEYKRTPTNHKLDKAGNKFITKMRRRHDGPISAAILELAGQVAFDDFVPGDTITLTVPGEWNGPARIAAIQLSQREGGDDDVLLEFEEVPFDASTAGNAEFGDGSSGSKGGGGGSGGGTCGDCPPLPPHVPNPSDCVYSDCVPSGLPWPYEGDAAGVSDGVDTGGALNKPVATAPWSCFLSPGTYNYDITASSADPGAYAWGFGISSNVNGSTGAAQNAFIGSGTAPDDPAVHITGTFTILDGAFSVPVPVYFWASVADSVHAHRAVTAHYKLWPVGEPDCSNAEPLDGQQHTEQFAGGSATITTGYPYASGSLRVTVGGVLVTPTETDPTTGVLTLPFIPPAGATVVVQYQNAGTTATGGGGTVPAAGGGFLENIGTAELDTTKVPHPDGAGGVVWGTDASGGGGPPVAALDDLTDVAITTPATADRLRYDGTTWVNSRLAWVPLMANAPNLVTTDGSAVYVPLTTSLGEAVMVETLT